MALDFSIPPRKAKKETMRCLKHRLVPFIRSSPGMGKSSLAMEIAAENRLRYVDVRVSQLTPEDFMGLPMRAIAPDGTLLPKGEFVPFSDMFPVEGVPLPLDAQGEPMNGWLLNLDEFNSGNRAIQAASYKLVLDRFAGQRKLHDMCFVMAAGNLKTDRAIVNDLSTAMQSRLIHLEMHVDKEDWLAWAFKKGIDHRITGYINYQPAHLHDFDPDHQDNTFPCPRTWEFVSKLIQGETDLDELQPTICGAIGKGVGVQFVHFAAEYQNLPTITEIINDPKKARYPTELSTRFATISHLMEHINKTNSKPVIEYMARFPEEEQVIFYRSVIQRQPAMANDPYIQKNLMTVMKFLNAD